MALVDPLDQTIMTDFITKNGYEWPFLYFRALLFSDTYAPAHVEAVDAEFDLNDLSQFTERYWGSIVEYVDEHDYDYLGELFEEWCIDELHKLALPEFSNIDIVSEGSEQDVSKNTVYLATSSGVDTALIKQLYASQLSDLLSKANEILSKKALFSELPKNDSTALLEKYEMWLDAALLADINSWADKDGYDILTVFIDLIITEKPCWRAFQRKYSSKSELHITKFGSRAHMLKLTSEEVYDPSNYSKKDLRRAFDLIRTYVKQGRGLINGAHQWKLSGVR